MKRHRLPNYDQLRHYWIVTQGDLDLPCALFLLQCDAEEWVNNQESKEVYKVCSPLAS